MDRGGVFRTTTVGSWFPKEQLAHVAGSLMHRMIDDRGTDISMDHRQILLRSGGPVVYRRLPACDKSLEKSVFLVQIGR